MTFNKFETNSYCVVGRHTSATKNVYGSKTSNGNKVLIGYRSIGNRKDCLTVSDKNEKIELSFLSHNKFKFQPRT